MEDSKISETSRPRKSDRRSRKTRAALMSALMHFLEEKPLHAITVSELADAADVNRATFYTHFVDVHDIYNQMQAEFCEQVAEIADLHAQEIAENDFAGLIHGLFSLLEEHSATMSVIYGKNGDGSFLAAGAEIVRDRLMAAWNPTELAKAATKGGKSNSPDASTISRLFNYQFDFIAAGALSVAKDWFEGGCVESVDAISAITNSFVCGNSKKTLERNILLLQED